MKNKIRGAQLEVIEDVQQWTSQSGTRCASLVCTIKGEEGLFKIIAFKTQVETLLKEDLLGAGKKIKCDIEASDNNGSDYIARRIYKSAPIRIESRVHGQGEGIDFSKADELYESMGLKKSFIRPIRGKVWAYVWE